MSNKKILKLNELLVLNVDVLTKRVSNRESERREFKLKFDNGNLPKLARTMASFANREGGVLFFGIRNQPRELIGVKENEIPDDVVFTNFLKEYFVTYAEPPRDCRRPNILREYDNEKTKLYSRD